MTNQANTPWHLWLVGIVAVLWNGLGATDYTMTQLGNRAWYTSMGLSESQTDATLAFMESAPMWSHAAVGCRRLGRSCGRNPVANT